LIGIYFELEDASLTQHADKNNVWGGLRSKHKHHIQLGAVHKKTSAVRDEGFFTCRCPDFWS